MTAPTFVDPIGCGCTDCLIGDSVPLDSASDAQITDLFAGRLHDRSSATFRVTVVLTVTPGAPSATSFESVRVQCGDLDWAPLPETFPMRLAIEETRPRPGAA